MSKQNFGGLLKVTSDQYSRLLSGETVILKDGSEVTYQSNIMYIVENAVDQIDSKLKTITTTANSDYMLALTDKTYAQEGYTNLYLPYYSGNYKVTFNPATGDLKSYNLVSTSNLISNGSTSKQIDQIVTKNTQEDINAYKWYTTRSTEYLTYLDKGPEANISQLGVKFAGEASIKYWNTSNDTMFTVGVGTGGDNGYGVFNHTTQKNSILVHTDGSVSFKDLGWKFTKDSNGDLIFTKI